MTPITYDFETYWTANYSLSKINFIEYIKSPDFEIISVSVKVGDGETKAVFGQDTVIEYLQTLDWANAAAIAHNGNEFDHAILTWVCDCHPKLFVDTLCLSRPRHQTVTGGSLKNLSAHYHLPEKDNTVLLNTQGKRYMEFDLDDMHAMAKYNRVDVGNTYALFKKFAPSTPRAELILSDMTARMICYPQFECDTALLENTLKSVSSSKQQQLKSLVDLLGALDTEGVREQLASAPKFAEVLRSLGVAPPTKISKTTGKATFAFAKTDEEFTALLDHEDERVQAVTSARLGEKSTLLETRLSKMITCARLMDGRLPVPLGYHSATTGRWGGRVWNPQNLPRINPKAPKLSDALRNSLVAPPGYMVVVSDSASIELRVNHYLWDVESTKRLFSKDPQADLYKEFAATLFSKAATDVSEDERQLAKVAQLGLGFGAGHKTFMRVAKNMGGIVLDEEEAERVTTAWRTKYVDIVRGWKKCHTAVHAMFKGASVPVDPLELVTTDSNKLALPSGRKLHYPNLVQCYDSEGGSEFQYGAGKNISRLYGPLLDENIVQAIARDILAEQAIQIQTETGYYPALMVHDELVYVVPEGQATEHLDTVNRAMRQAPSWAPGLVLWSKGGMALTYGAGK